MKNKLLPATVLALLFVVQLWAAITIGTTTVDGDTANTVTTDAIDTTGSTMVAVACAYFGAADPPTVSDSKSNTWENLTAECSAASNCIRFSYFGGGTVGSGHTFTCAGTSKFPAILVWPLLGTLAASPSDGESAGGNTSAGPPLQPGSLTPSQDNSIVLTAIGFIGNHGTATIDGGFTVNQQLESDNVNYDGIAGASLIQTTATAVNPSWGWDTGLDGAAVSAAFKVAAAGGAAVRSRSLLQVGP